jgi:antitoxin component YwqK of YwqJK toxin-antitoxin module
MSSLDESQVEERDGLVYEFAETVPFTGKVTGLFFDSRPRMECHYKNGKKDGPSTTWYQNGRVRMQSGYKAGKRDGRWVKWAKSGQIQFQKIYRDGMRVN